MGSVALATKFYQTATILRKFQLKEKLQISSILALANTTRSGYELLEVEIALHY